MMPPLALLDQLTPAYPAFAATVFLCVMAPVWLYMAWYDMAHLKILNGLVLFVLGVFVVIGPLVLPFSLYLGQLLQMAVVFVAILVLYAAGTMGGGDAKFIAVASPFFMREDWLIILTLFLTMTLAGFALHKSLAMLGGRRLTPDWLSWSSGRRFPLGLVLGGVVTLYLAAAAL